MSVDDQPELLELIYDDKACACHRLAAIGNVMLLNNNPSPNKCPWNKSWRGIHQGLSLNILCGVMLEAEPRKQRTPKYYLNAAALWVEEPEVYLPCTRLTFKTDAEMISYEFNLNFDADPALTNGLMELAIEDYSAYLLGQAKAKSA